MTRRVEILQRKTVFSRFIFRIDELQLRYEKFDGSMGTPVRRLILDRGEAAAVLLHDPEAGVVLLCEQFRAATLANGSGWLVELPAGMLDNGETAEACAQREIGEETGQVVQTLTRIASVFASPGGSSELIHIFYGTFSLPDNLPETAGVATEGEDILVVPMPLDEAFARLQAGAIQDAKTLIALQWLNLHIRTSVVSSV